LKVLSAGECDRSRVPLRDHFVLLVPSSVSGPALQSPIAAETAQRKRRRGLRVANQFA
jgi:hypothetical protein